jgi:hypothetical protein
MKNPFSTLFVFVAMLLITPGSQASERPQKMPALVIQGLDQATQRVVAFAVNGKEPLISSGSQAMVSWVNGRSDHVLSSRRQAEIPSFNYIPSNVQIVRYDTNYVVLMAFPTNKATPAHLSRQLDDPRCPALPQGRALGYNPNDGCRPGSLSPYMSDIIGFVSLERILNDPAVKQGRPAVLIKGRDF